MSDYVEIWRQSAEQPDPELRLRLVVRDAGAASATDLGGLEIHLLRLDEAPHPESGVWIPPAARAAFLAWCRSLAAHPLAEALARNLTIAPHIQPGWRGLYERMCRDLVAAGDPVVVRGTTEKFGGLRITLTGKPTEAGSAIVTAAEGASRGVCEACGVPARPSRRGGWWRTRCAAHVDWRWEDIGAT